MFVVLSVHLFSLLANQKLMIMVHFPVVEDVVEWSSFKTRLRIKCYLHRGRKWKVGIIKVFISGIVSNILPKKILKSTIPAVTK